MKLKTLTLAAAAVALLGSAAHAQQTQPAAPPSEPITTEVAQPAAEAQPPAEAPAAPAVAADVAATASFTNVTVTNGPVPDTAENRAKYGQPLSNAGKRSAPKSN